MLKYLKYTIALNKTLGYHSSDIKHYLFKKQMVTLEIKKIQNQK